MKSVHYKIDGLQCALWNRKNLEDLRHNGMDAVHVTIAFWESARETLDRIGEWHALFQKYDDLIMPIKKPEDFAKAKGSQKTGIILGSQNLSIIDDSRALVSVFRELGVIISQLSYNNQGLAATGCYEADDPGITRFGHEVIGEMNRVGMIIDMSHSSERSTLEAIDISRRPITISHANPQFFRDCLRNKSRNVITALANKGGMLGLSLYSPHLPEGAACSIDSFCQMIEELTSLIGIDQVGIGSDLVTDQPLSVLNWMRSGRWASDDTDTGGCTPDLSWPDPVPWFRDNRGLHNLGEALLQRGFSEQDVYKILGNNWHRFISEQMVQEEVVS